MPPVLSQDDICITTDLYTLQGYDLREFRGKVELAKGTYRQMPCVSTRHNDGSTKCLGRTRWSGSPRIAPSWSARRGGSST